MLQLFWRRTSRHEQPVGERRRRVGCSWVLYAERFYESDGLQQPHPTDVSTYRPIRCIHHVTLQQLRLYRQHRGLFVYPCPWRTSAPTAENDSGTSAQAFACHAPANHIPSEDYRVLDFAGAICSPAKTLTLKCPSFACFVDCPATA